MWEVQGSARTGELVHHVLSGPRFVLICTHVSAVFVLMTLKLS